MDSAYLQSTVGQALTVALAKVAIARPDDPIDFIAQFLYKYTADLETDKKERIEFAAIQAVLDAKAEQERRAAQLAAEAARIQAEEEAKRAAEEAARKAAAEEAARKAAAEEAARRAAAEEAARKAAQEAEAEAARRAAELAASVPTLNQGDSFSFEDGTACIALEFSWSGATGGNAGAAVLKAGQLGESVGADNAGSESGVLAHAVIASGEDGNKRAESVTVQLGQLDVADKVLAFVLPTEGASAGALEGLSLGVSTADKRPLFRSPLSAHDTTAASVLALALTHNGTTWSARVLDSASEARTLAQVGEAAATVL